MVLALDLSPFDLVTRIGFHPVPLVVIVAMSIWYRRGIRRLAAQGRRWPPVRTAAFVAAVVLLAVATLSGLVSYDDTSFSVAAVQQIGIFLFAPVALCLSAPLTLAIESAPGASGERIRRVVTGPAGRVLYNPALTWAVFAASLFTLYLSREYAWALSHTGGLWLVDLELLAVGSLFVWPVIGADPKPRVLAIGWRMLYVLLCVVYYSVLGLAMESQRRPIAPGLTVSDLHTGAGVLWSTGALFSIALSIGILVEWLQVDEGHAQRADNANAAEDARQLARWRADRRAAALADVRARESLIVRSRPVGTERSDRSAQSTRSWAPGHQELRGSDPDEPDDR